MSPYEAIGGEEHVPDFPMEFRKRGSILCVRMLAHLLNIHHMFGVWSFFSIVEGEGILDRFGFQING